MYERKIPTATYFLQVCSAIIKSTIDNKIEAIRVLLDNGGIIIFITCIISQKSKLSFIKRKLYLFMPVEPKKQQRKSYDVVKIKLENIEALKTNKVSAAF